MMAMKPESTVAVSADGDLAACATLAAKLITSNMIPTFVVAAAAGNGERTADHAQWRLHVGFEGFAATVRDQGSQVGEQCVKAGFHNVDLQAYDVYTGNFNQHLDSLERKAFVVRADMPQAKVALFVESTNGKFPRESVMLDFGCGRVFWGMDQLKDADWSHVTGEAHRLDGHVLLVKAPDEFKRRHDVFGLERSDWQVMHRVKAALDPDGIFAPGRLPGKR